MDSTRPEPRIPADLPVRVWGMSSNGRAFSQSARAQNISSEGALLSGIDYELTVGDVIGVQYKEKKARFKVIWVINAGSEQKVQAGVQVLADQQAPWKLELPVAGKDVAPAESNRRRFSRHKIPMPMEIRDETAGAPMRVQVTDVSGNGCYVETILPLPKATNLRVEFWIDEKKIAGSAVVRTCDPGVGMGLEFTGLTPETKQHVQEYLDRLDPPRGVME
ncbi:MAG TPA: PilZ domain-containing protein [Terriglobales bacterium]|jgi:PilZ domain|nr:PilZ domain-containing protein [Terriglobales bacterium]